MQSTAFSDALRLIQSSTSILVVLPKNPSLDEVASAAVLSQIYTTERCRVAVYSPQIITKKEYQALPTVPEIITELTNLREFIIRVRLTSATLQSLRYETTPSELQLFLQPKKGSFDAKDVQTASSAFAYDLIITIGVTSIEMLGDEAREQREFFSHTPTICIDHTPTHEQYGQVNLVDVTASSCCEILVSYLQTHDALPAHEEIATALLAGIMSKTKGFQSATLTPRALSGSAALLTAGARRDDVVKQLYQNKTLPVLRLWGKALSRLQYDTAVRAAYTHITREDIRQTEATPEAAASLFDELLMAAQEPIVLLAVEGETDTTVHVLVRDQVHLQRLPEHAQHITHQYATVSVAGRPTDALHTALRWWQ